MNLQKHLTDWMNGDESEPFPDTRIYKEPMLPFDLSNDNREALSDALLNCMSDREAWIAYQHLAICTESPVDPWSVADEAGNKEPFSWQERYEHGTIGFLTELGELLDICKKHRFYGKPWLVYGKGGIVEELGDALWYAAIRNHAGYFLDTYIPLTDFGFPLVSDHWSKYLPPLAPARTEIMECFRLGATQARDPYWTLGSLDRIKNAFQQEIGDEQLPSWRQIAIINIQKLHGTRYPGGVFSQKAAVDRDLDAEEESLQERPTE